MPRPKHPRHIASEPLIREFRPDSGPGHDLVPLSLDEFEAIRLIDYQGLDQSQAAQIMNVSRQTVGRILKSGRYKQAKALVEGQGLKLGGGCYRIRGRGRRRGAGCNPGRGQFPKDPPPET